MFNISFGLVKMKGYIMLINVQEHSSCCSLSLECPTVNVNMKKI